MQALGRRLLDGGGGLISIVVPVWNQHEMTKECLEAVAEHTRSLYELIVVDNGSSPPIDGGTIRNEENLGFPKAANQGCREAKGDVIVLLNNDVIVTPGWDVALLKHLERYDIVGPLTNFSIGIQRTGVPTYTNREQLDQIAVAWGEEHQGESKEVKWVIGFCFAMWRDVYEAVGEFDESLWPCSGEEIDFCYRAREKGYRVGVARDLFVHHSGSQTFEAMERAGVIDYMKVVETSNGHLKAKWGENVLKQHLEQDDLDGFKLNLGCGFKKLKGYTNLDNRAAVGPDVLWDVTNGLPFDTSSVDVVRAYDFLEHIPAGKTAALVEEIWRVLKPGGLFESCTPDAERGQGAYQDPFHVSFWCENSWLYYSHPGYREIYGITADFEIESMQRVETDRARRVWHLHVKAIARKGDAG